MSRVHAAGIAGAALLAAVAAAQRGGLSPLSRSDEVKAAWEPVLTASNRATVQPLIAMVTTAGLQVQREQVASVPVFQFGGGNCMLSFNLQHGDLGWIKANDRDISLFLANYNAAPPNTQRMHDFADAVFFPDIMRNYTIHEEDEGHAVLQTADGSQRIALWPDKVKITATEILADTQTFTVTGIIQVPIRWSDCCECLASDTTAVTARGRSKNTGSGTLASTLRSFELVTRVYPRPTARFFQIL